jgi:hypothetical protein
MTEAAAEPAGARVTDPRTWALVTAVVVVAVLLVGGVVVAAILQADADAADEPPDCIAVADDALDFVGRWGDAGRSVLSSLDWPDLDDECGPVIDAVISETSADGSGPPTTQPG